VGKTTSCVNLAYLAAGENRRVLLCDLDPQGAASFYLRIRSSKKFRAKHLLKGRKRINKNIKGTDFHNLDLLPSSFSYRHLDLLLNKKKHSQYYLKNLLEKFQGDYHYIFIDCPPNITLVSENIFIAAHLILVPVIPTTLSLRSYQQLSNFFTRYKYDFRKLLAFFSMVEHRKLLHRQIIMTSAQEHLPFLHTQIPYSAAVEKMGLFRKPIVVHRPKSKAAQAYMALWHELRAILNKMNMKDLIMP